MIVDWLRTIRNICNESIKDKSPGHGIEKSLLELVHLEMLVTNSLLIDADSLDCQYTILWTEPASVELIVGHEEQEEDSDTYREKTSDEKHNLPRFNGRAVDRSAASDAIGHQTTKDLGKAVEREPDTDTSALLLFGVPLAREEGKS